jgi:hypothetical protein
MRAGISFSALVSSCGGMYDKSNAAADGTGLSQKGPFLIQLHHP